MKDTYTIYDTNENLATAQNLSFHTVLKSTAYSKLNIRNHNNYTKFRSENSIKRSETDRDACKMNIDKKLTIPILRCDEKRPRIGLSAGASFLAAFGGIICCMKRNERS